MQPNLSLKQPHNVEDAKHNAEDAKHKAENIKHKAEDAAQSGQTPNTDYSLLLKRLKNSLLHSEEDLSSTNAILKKSDIWQQLDPSQMADWAALSQIAGDIELALQIYSYLTKHYPDFKKGQAEYSELLSILNRQAASEPLPLHQTAQDSAVSEPLPLHQTAQDSAVSEPLPLHQTAQDSAASLPFEQMIQKRELMEYYLNLFSGREDIFARQWADKNENKSGYVPIRYAITLANIEEHLNGLKTYGIYLLKSNSQVKCGVIDADINPQYRTGKITAEQRNTVYREKSWMISRIFENSKELGITPLLEYSGHKGYHFWYFFSQPVDASKVKAFLTRVAEPVNRDITSFHLEVFPKQEKLTEKGLGNLVKLPLGIHRKNGKPSFFMECAKRDLESQLFFLKKVQIAAPDILDSAFKLSCEEQNNQVVLHPRMAAIAKDYPELYELERLCPPIGQIIGISRDGKNLNTREEKILLQTIGFLPRAKHLIHYIMARCSEYNPHLVDFKISRITGTPLGCKKIHSLLGFTGDYCPLKPDSSTGYIHPLIHLQAWKDAAEKKTPKGMRIENLQDALENMKCAIVQLQRFI